MAGLIPMWRISWVFPAGSPAKGIFLGVGPRLTTVALFEICPEHLLLPTEGSCPYLSPNLSAEYQSKLRFGSPVSIIFVLLRVPSS